MCMNYIKCSFFCNYFTCLCYHIKIHLHNPINEIVWINHIIIYSINFNPFIIFKIWCISFSISNNCNFVTIFY